MLTIPKPAPKTSPPATSSYLGPATVMELNPDEQLVLVEWQKTGHTRRSWARPALSSPVKLKPRDTVLVISQDLEDFYLIGFLDAAPTTLETKTGARAVLAHSAAEEVLQVHSPRGELVIEYHPESGKTRVNVDSGDLEFVARNGSISFHSAQDIRMGARAVSILSRRGAALGVLDARGQISSSLALTADSLKTHSPELEVTAQQAELRIKQTRFSGETFHGEIGVLKLVLRRFETVADTVVDRMKNVYRTVEELVQLQAGRVRTLVKGSCHLKARNAFLKADESFKLDGERIDIG